MKIPAHLLLLAFFSALAAAAPGAPKVDVPDWAWPGTATHQQVPPPADFHRPTVTLAQPIGVFEAQSDIGGPLLPGSSSYDAATGRYTINSASYNIWYTRDEFRYLWKKCSGDVSLAATVAFPNPEGYGDRKAVLVIRQDLDDDAKEIMAALHGAGLIHLAQRPEKGANLKEDQRLEAPKTAALQKSGTLRIGIEKRGDEFMLFVGRDGEPMRPVGTASQLRFDAPFYVGIGFCSHVPDQSDTAVLSAVVFENAAGQVR